MKTHTFARTTVTAFLAATFLFGTSDASACGASAWVFDDGQLPECVESISDESSTFHWTNACEETLELTVIACEGECTVPSEIAPGETGALVFEEHPDGARLVDVQWTLGDESDVARIEYLYGPCPNGNLSVDERVGCSSVVVRARS